MASVSTERRHFLRIGISLELFSILWMVVEGGIGIAAGVVARSVSLEAFGVDSVLELVSASIVLWWLLLSSRGADPERTHDAGELAERVVGVGLLALALYVLVGAIYQLATRSRPETSAAGLILSVVAVLVMPALYWLKRGNAERLDRQATRGDAFESLGCGWMACALLIGLALHRFFGWWWADPAAALVLVYFLLREGWEGVHEWFETHEASADAAEYGPTSQRRILRCPPYDLGRRGANGTLQAGAAMHNHEGHQHAGEGVRARNRRALGIALGVTAIFAAVELAGGLFTGSLALVADAVTWRRMSSLPD